MSARPFVSALAVFLAVFPGQGTSARASVATDVVLNIGHRGASGLAPEHTIAAYDLALKLGADYIEQDLQITSDGVLVVLHDTTLDRTARGPAENCTGDVSSKTLAQVKTCDMGSWFNEEYPEKARGSYVGLRIPTLEEVFQRYRRKVNYHIETKSPEQAPGMEEELLRLMDEYDLREDAVTRWRVLIQSFSPASLIKIHDLDPGLPLIQLHRGEEASRSGRPSMRLRAMPWAWDLRSVASMPPWWKPPMTGASTSIPIPSTRSPTWSGYCRWGWSGGSRTSPTGSTSC